MNRDWTWLSQRETQARVAKYREWNPQVFVDLHEMGSNSTYFFPPDAKPINVNLPKDVEKWLEVFGRANAEQFTKRGWPFFVAERFDMFYPGYGDSWPSLNGAIGMTYEQAGSVGVRVKRADENILTLADRIEHHSTTSLATLKATADRREQRMRDFYTFFKDAIHEGAAGPIQSYIISPEKDPPRALKMARLLRSQGIDVLYTREAFTLDGLKT